MKNITISLPDELWAQVKDQAAEHRLSMNAYIREMIEKCGDTSDDTWGPDFVELAKKSNGRSDPGWKFNRTEMYDEVA